MAMPLARDVVEAIAIQNGVCIRPVSLRRTDISTGQAEIVDVPCGATLDSKCPACAKRNRQLRMAQCQEGWHLDREPINSPNEADDYQRFLVELRADAQVMRDEAEFAGADMAFTDELIGELDEEISANGMRGNVLGRTAPKRSRSTRRRQDAPDLPKRKMADTTLGRVFTSNDGKTFRPSLFVTLTLPSYGKVKDGVPVEPATYDYERAARDALHFSKLVDRFVQNLRRVAGYDVQYFAAVEPQKRLAPHLHMAIRGTLPRAEIKQIAAATYHQVWWPPADVVRFEGDHLPVWEDGYLDPHTGEYLPTWDEALDRLDQDAAVEPLHVVRFGVQVDVKGVLAGSTDADQCVRYLSKYLTKSISEIIDHTSQATRDHAYRMAEALRFEPCSATCPNWLRYGVQPKDAKPGMAPGRCKGKAHKPEYLGYAGRRVLVSRKWSNKTLTEHKQDRRTWVLEALGLSATPAEDRARFTWKPVHANDPDLAPIGVRLLRSVAERQRWRAALERLQDAGDDEGKAA
jgi:hypothetical protein